MFGTFIPRMALFLATNMAVLFVFGIVLQLLGLDQAGYSTSGMLLFAALFGFGGSLFSLFASKWLAKRSAGVVLIEHPSNATEAWLVQTVADFSEKAGIGMPDVGIFPSPAPNAFATGARRNHALVAVSAGLLQTMDKREVEAVLAHEIAHVANGDMITMTLLQGVLNTFVIFAARVVGMVVDSALSGGKNRRGGIGYFLTSMVAQVVFGFLASIIVMWFSRRREFRADHGAAQLTDPESMIAALEALKSPQREPLPKALAAFGIDGGGVKKLLSTHPPLDDRIAALREFKA